MSETVTITTDETSEAVTITVDAGLTEAVTLSSTETVESVTIEVSEDAFSDPTKDWFSLVVGVDVDTELSTTLPGEVIQLDYKGGSTYYRYIADDDSIDGIYDSYTPPATLGNLIVEKKLNI